MLHGALQQKFRQQPAWTNLDYLIYDLLLGTGDVALSLSEDVLVAGAIVRDDAAAGLARRHATCDCDVQEAEDRRSASSSNMSHFVCANRRSRSRTSSDTAAANRW